MERCIWISHHLYYTTMFLSSSSWPCVALHIGPQRRLTCGASAGATSSSCPSNICVTTACACSALSLSTLALRCFSPSKDSYWWAILNTWSWVYAYQIWHVLRAGEIKKTCFITERFHVSFMIGLLLSICPSVKKSRFMFYNRIFYRSVFFAKQIIRLCKSVASVNIIVTVGTGTVIWLICHII